MTLPAQAACRPARGPRRAWFGEPFSSKKARAASAFTSTPHSVAARTSQHVHRFSAQHKSAPGRSPARSRSPSRASCGGRGKAGLRGAPGGTALPVVPHVERLGALDAGRRGDLRGRDQPDWGVAPGSYPKRGDGVAEGGLSVGSARAASSATPATATTREKLGHRRAGEAPVAPRAAAPVGLASEVAREVVNFLRGRARTRAPSSPPRPRRRNRPRSPNHSPRGGDAHDMSARAFEREARG